MLFERLKSYADFGKALYHFRLFLEMIGNESMLVTLFPIVEVTGVGGTYAAAGRLLVCQGNRSKGLLTGLAKVEPKSWHHVVMVREGERIRVYLNGNPKPDIDGKFARSYPKSHPQFFLGGRNDNFANLQGRLDEVALYDRVLTPDEVSAHFKAVKLSTVSKKQR